VHVTARLSRLNPLAAACEPSERVRSLAAMDELLFHGPWLSDALTGQTEKMRQAVKGEPETNLLQADAEAWAEALAHHYGAECPNLMTDDVWQEPPADTTVDVSYDNMRAFRDPYSERARNFPGYRVVVHFPFEGDAGVFKLRPNQYTMDPPRGRVGKNELLLTITFPQDQPRQIDPAAQEFLSNVQRYLGWARGEIETFNAQLKHQAMSAIAGRRQRISQRDAALAESTIPVRRIGDDGKKTYIADALVRRPAPSLPRNRSDDNPPALEPTLDDKVFEHVLSVIRQQSLMIEQHANTYVAMGEEDRRNVILGALATHYSGFTAETDNQGGHTDILARYENRNVFIGECKFWSGEQGFAETIDQLFGYTGWRDTKLAIVMFVRAKGLTAILEKGRQALAAHPQFVRWKDAASETELRATMRWPGDDERLADLNVFFVHTPA
jgi:hypothetical protein